MQAQDLHRCMVLYLSSFKKRTYSKVRMKEYIQKTTSVMKYDIKSMGAASLPCINKFGETPLNCKCISSQENGANVGTLRLDNTTLGCAASDKNRADTTPCQRSRNHLAEQN